MEDASFETLMFCPGVKASLRKVSETTFSNLNLGEC